MYDDDDRPDPFRDLIQKDPVVCDNCFMIRYEVVSAEYWRGSFGWSDYVSWIPIPDNNKRVPANDPSGGVRLACGNCGHRRTKYRPIPKKWLPDVVENISTTLDKKEIQHDPDVLWAEVQERNTSENQGRQDSHVFSPAVERAIATQNLGDATDDDR